MKLLLHDRKCWCLIQASKTFLRLRTLELWNISSPRSHQILRSALNSDFNACLNIPYRTSLHRHHQWSKTCSFTLQDQHRPVIKLHGVTFSLPLNSKKKVQICLQFSELVHSSIVQPQYLRSQILLNKSELTCPSLTQVLIFLTLW